MITYCADKPYEHLYRGRLIGFTSQAGLGAMSQNVRLAAEPMAVPVVASRVVEVPTLSQPSYISQPPSQSSRRST